LDATAIRPGGGGRRALCCDQSGLPICYQALADALGTSGRPQEALSAIEKTIRLDPGGGDFYAYFVGSLDVAMGRYQETILLLKRHLAAYPDELWGLVTLVLAYTELGQNEAARAEASEILRVNPQFKLMPPELEPNKSIELNRRYNDDMRKAGLK
jgi:adenylate cyclase